MTISYTTDARRAESTAAMASTSQAQRVPEKTLRLRALRQERANRATRRAAWTFLVPWLGVPVAAFYWFALNDVIRAGVSALAAFGLALLLSPLMLWWATSGLRRGSRHLLLGIFMGSVGAVLFTIAVTGALSAGLGWSLITGEQLPVLPNDFDLTRWIFLSPENPLNPNPLQSTLGDLTQR
jgi:hypothetical protein